MKVKRCKGAICFLAILNTTEHLHPRAVLDAKPPPVSNNDDDDDDGNGDGDDDVAADVAISRVTGRVSRAYRIICCGSERKTENDGFGMPNLRSSPVSPPYSA